MKKLLSALFILGSVVALATPSESVQGASNCYVDSCKVEKEFDVKVKIPKKLELTVAPVDFGMWCGTTAKEKKSNYSIDGEKNSSVKLTLTPSVEFGSGNSKFTATLALDSNSKPLDNNGKAQGQITAKLVPSNKQLPSGQYTAKAKLTATYDSAWINAN